MKHTLHRLKDRECETATPKESATTYGIKMLNDGGGLLLMVRNINGTICKSWVFRYAERGSGREILSREGKSAGQTYTRQRTRLMGLGVYGKTAVTLAQARNKAAECRKLLEAGIDPLGKRKAEKAEAEAARSRSRTFDECLDEFIQTHEGKWGNADYRHKVKSQLRRYASSIIGSMLISDITKADVIRVLEQPIDGGQFWKVMNPTATKVREKIEAILDYAKARDYRQGDNPATWALLAHVLAARPKGDEDHQPSLPFTQMAEFMIDLRSHADSASLEFLILTAARKGEVIGMSGEEIDRERKLWIIPAARMKMKREHRVPLSDRALAMVAHAKPGELVFPQGNRKMIRLIERMNRAREDRGLQPYVDPLEGNKKIVPHGFRATFKTWAEEKTPFPRTVIEAALAHAKGGALEDSYNRGELLDKRRVLMEKWTLFCEGGADILPLRSIA